MSWRNVVKPLSTADVAGNLVSQRFRHPTKGMVVDGVVLGLAGYNDPAFGELRVRIYSDRNGAPGKLIATSTNGRLKAAVHTLANFMKWATFSFDEVQLQAGEWYHLVLVPSAYTGVDASFLAWRISYPDPQYPLVAEDDGDLNAAGAARHHLDFALHGYAIEEED